MSPTCSAPGLSFTYEHTAGNGISNALDSTGPRLDGSLTVDVPEGFSLQGDVALDVNTTNWSRSSNFLEGEVINGGSEVAQLTLFRNDPTRIESSRTLSSSSGEQEFFIEFGTRFVDNGTIATLSLENLRFVTSGNATIDLCLSGEQCANAGGTLFLEPGSNLLLGGVDYGPGCYETQDTCQGQLSDNPYIEELFGGLARWSCQNSQLLDAIETAAVVVAVIAGAIILTPILGPAAPGAAAGFVSSLWSCDQSDNGTFIPGNLNDLDPACTATSTALGGAFGFVGGTGIVGGFASKPIGACTFGAVEGGTTSVLLGALDDEEVDPWVHFLDAGVSCATAGVVSRASAARIPTSSPWDQGWSQRGFEIERILGPSNLPDSFPTIDVFSNGRITSIKSIDLSGVSYQTLSRLRSRLTGYVDEVADFNGASLSGVTVDPADITSRELLVGIQTGAASTVQREVLDEVVQDAAIRGVTVRIVEIP